MRRTWVALCALAVLAVLPYVRAVSLPRIADDYLQVELGRTYGPIDRWDELALDPLYRCRATSVVLTWWTERVFGVTAGVMHAQSLLLHVLNVWLVFAVGLWKPLGWRTSFWAAAFFAICQTHEEAVIWYAALPELLLFAFSMTALVAWIAWLQGQGGRWRTALPALTVAAFALACLSKEPGVALIPLLGLLAWTSPGRPRAAWAWLAFMGALAVGYTSLSMLGANRNQHFSDGTFAWYAPFWKTWANSLGRMFWVWGMAALALLRWTSDRFPPMAKAGLIWSGVALLPYSFVMYMPRVPSRHTYLASAGMSLVVAMAFLALRARCAGRLRWVPAAVAVAVTLQQCGYVWTKKHRQYLDRAEPTEAIIRQARTGAAPVVVKGFPYATSLGPLVMDIGAGRPGVEVVFHSASTGAGAP